MTSRLVVARQRHGGKKKEEEKRTKGNARNKNAPSIRAVVITIPGICIMATYARHVAIFHRAHTWERSWNISPGNAVLVAAAIATPVTSRLINADVVERSATG